MAFTRKFLSAMGLEAEKIDEIMTAHVEVIDHYKNQLDESKKLSDEIDTLKTANADLTKQLKDATDKITAYEKEDYKTKYESEKTEHDKLKADVAGKETLAKKESVLRKELKNKKYSEEAANLIISKGGYTDKIDLGKDGKATNIDSIFESINSDFSMFTPRETVKGSVPDNPPINAGGKKTMTKAEIMAIRNTAERQQKIAENPTLFGMPDNA